MARRVLAGRRVRYRADICDRKQEGEKKCVRRLLCLVPSRGGDDMGERWKRKSGGKAGSRVWKRKGWVAKRAEATIFTRA